MAIQPPCFDSRRLTSPSVLLSTFGWYLRRDLASCSAMTDVATLRVFKVLHESLFTDIAQEMIDCGYSIEALQIVKAWIKIR